MNLRDICICYETKTLGETCNLTEGDSYVHGATVNFCKLVLQVFNTFEDLKDFTEWFEWLYNLAYGFWTVWRFCEGGTIFCRLCSVFDSNCLTTYLVKTLHFICRQKGIHCADHNSRVQYWPFLLWLGFHLIRATCPKQKNARVTGSYLFHHCLYCTVYCVAQWSELSVHRSIQEHTDFCIFLMFMC